MQITITYCVRWNYLPEAVSLTAEIKRELGVEPKLVEGDKGIFDVAADGSVVYSKHQTGRFPNPGEVVAALRKR